MIYAPSPPSDQDSAQMVIISVEQAQMLARALTVVLVSARKDAGLPVAEERAVEGLRGMLARAR